MLNRRFNPISLLIAAAALTPGGAIAPPGAGAAPDNPVYVDDSPLAGDLFRRAQDHAGDNVGESVRLFQELLDGYATRIIAVNGRRPVNGGPRGAGAGETGGGPDQFVSVHSRVLRELNSNPDLLQRYQLIEQAPAQRRLDAGELTDLAVSRSLTGPGLEALLRLAQRELEAGRFNSCLRWAEEAATHPSIEGAKLAHAWHMIGLAADRTGRLELAGAAEAALSAKADPTSNLLLAELRRLSGVGAGGAGHLSDLHQRRGVSSLDATQATNLDQLVAEPIWSVPLTEMMVQRSNLPESEQFIGRAPIRDRPRGDYLTAAPTVAGETIFVNEGHRVSAYHRYTERLNWSFPSTETPRAPGGRLRTGDIGEVGDLNIVAVGDGAVVTLTGHASTQRRSGQGEVICLDAETGSLRWSARLDAVAGHFSDQRQEELVELFPHGAPVIFEGKVLVLARKVTRQLLSSTYLVCLKLEDGSLEWSRHIASCGGIRTNLSRAFSTVTLWRGKALVASSTGAIACVDAATGLTDWLRRFDVPLAPGGGSDTRPWEVDAPVMTSAGVIAVQPDSRRVVVLDPETGDLLASYAADSQGWGFMPRYLLADDRFVYCISRSRIRAFDLHDLGAGHFSDEPQWVMPAIDETEEAWEPAGGGGAGRVEIRGRVQLAGNSLIVPTEDRFLILDRETGASIHEIPTGSFGNPLAVDNQLIVATDERLDVYMPFARAEAMLRERIAARPLDPEPALALMRLALRGNDFNLALEAGDLAWRSVGKLENIGREEGRNDAHEELFAMLLTLDSRRIAASIDQEELLHALIGQVAITASQRLDAQLAYGDWLAARRPGGLGEAVEAYQSILTNPQLGSALRVQGDVARSGSAWALQRIASLIQDKSRGVYEPQAAFARQRLDSVLAAAAQRGAQPDPDQLTELVRQYPFSDAAVEAAIIASRRYADSAQPRRALAALYELAWIDLAPDSRDRLIGAIVDRLIEQQWVAQAQAVLQRMIAQQPQRPLISASGPIRPADWLANLSAGVPAVDPLPRLGHEPGDGLWVEGTLLLMTHTDAPAARHNRALVSSGTVVRMLTAAAGGGLHDLWSSDIAKPAPSVLRFDDDAVLLWAAANPDDPRAILLDATTGREKWITPIMRNLLPAPFERGPAIELPGGELFRPDEVLPVPGRSATDSLLLVRRTGGIVALDGRDGSTVLWKRPHTIDQVHIAKRHDFGVVLAGVRRRIDAAESFDPVVLVIDPQTGETLQQATPLSPHPPQWLAFSDFGRVVFGTGSDVEAIDLLAGAHLNVESNAGAPGSRIVWANAAPIVQDTLRGRALKAICESQGAGPQESGARQLNPESCLLSPVLIEDRLAELTMLDAAAGAVITPLDPPLRGGWTPREIRGVHIEGASFAVRYSDRIVRFDLGGGVIGADIVTDDREYRQLLSVRDAGAEARPAQRESRRWLAVSRYQTRQADGVGRGGVPVGRISHTYRIYPLAEDCRLLAEPLELPDLHATIFAAAAIDGWLLLSLEPSTDAAILAVPMPAASEPRP